MIVICGCRAYAVLRRLIDEALNQRRWCVAVEAPILNAGRTVFSISAEALPERRRKVPAPTGRLDDRSRRDGNCPGTRCGNCSIDSSLTRIAIAPRLNSRGVISRDRPRSRPPGGLRFGPASPPPRAYHCSGCRSGPGGCGLPAAIFRNGRTGRLLGWRIAWCAYSPHASSPTPGSQNNSALGARLAAARVHLPAGRPEQGDEPGWPGPSLRPDMRSAEDIGIREAARCSLRSSNCLGAKFIA